MWSKAFSAIAIYFVMSRVFVSIYRIWSSLDDFDRFDIDSAKLESLENIKKPAREYLTKVEEILFEVDPQLRESYKKNKQNYLDQLNIILRDKGLTKQEKIDKIRNELYPIWTPPLEADYIQLPEHVQLQLERVNRDAVRGIKIAFSDHADVFIHEDVVDFGYNDKGEPQKLTKDAVDKITEMLDILGQGDNEPQYYEEFLR